MRRSTLGLATMLLALPVASWGADEAPLPGTRALAVEGELASRMIDGIDGFLLRKTEASLAGRARFWHRDFSTPEAYAASIRPNRERLAHILGVRDERPPSVAPEMVATFPGTGKVATGENYEIFEVRWPAFGDVHGEGLLLVPTGGKVVADVVAIPDADQTPEQFAGLAEGLPEASQFARRLAESGCRVVVPALIDRKLSSRGTGGRS